MNINRVPKVTNCGPEDPSKLKYNEASFLPLPLRLAFFYLLLLAAFKKYFAENIP